jgi:hypothetical protein
VFLIVDLDYFALLTILSIRGFFQESSGFCISVRGERSSAAAERQNTAQAQAHPRSQGSAAANDLTCVFKPFFPPNKQNNKTLQKTSLLKQLILRYDKYAEVVPGKLRVMRVIRREDEYVAFVVVTMWLLFCEVVVA